MNPPIKGCWAKLKRDEVPGESKSRIVGWHPLEHHCADVAAVLEGLLGCETIQRRLARLGGREELDDVDISRLCYLGALHDAGKVNHGFQAKRDPALRSSWAGHVQEVIALCFDKRGPNDLFNKAIDALRLLDLLPWFDDDEYLLTTYCCASFAHHGKPVPVEGTNAPVRSIWERSEGRDPMAGLRELADAAKSWFPDAFVLDHAALPKAQPFIHGYSGLLMLADWIGSDSSDRAFPFSVDGTTSEQRMEFARERASLLLSRLGLNPHNARQQLTAESTRFDALKSDPQHRARPAQSAIEELEVSSSGSTVVLEAETGSGKTEAALIHYLKLFHAGHVDGLYFALPTRTAATQIYERVVEALQRVFPDADTRPAVVLAVPGYLRVDDAEGRRGPGFDVRWEPTLASPESLWNDDERERFRYRGWAAEHSKRYLAGAVVVGTIDQVLMSALRVNHAHLRASALLRHLLVVDEVHASDAYMTEILTEVLDRHRAAGGHAFLMSATLGGAARTSLLGRDSQCPSLDSALEAPYPLLSYRKEPSPTAEHSAVEHDGRRRTVTTQLVDDLADPKAVAVRALAAARQGARVLVLRNTVNACIATQRCVESLVGEAERDLLFAVGSVAAPHHARFAKEDRQALDRAIEKSLGKSRSGAQGQIAVATQTVQQSLDLDADLLITDLCPMDVLLQRVGRLHRHDRTDRPVPYQSPIVVVLVPDAPALDQYLSDKGDARGPRGSGIGTVYDDLRILQATWDLLAGTGTLQIPDAARALVEPTVHPEALDTLAKTRGERWEAHAVRLAGRIGADRTVARLNVFRLDEDFSQLSFHRPDDGQIKTRLGEGDRLVELPEPWLSPFGERVRFITLPYWLARGAEAATGAEDVQAGDDVLSFRFGERQLVYDRWGLREREKSQ